MEDSVISEETAQEEISEITEISENPEMIQETTAISENYGTEAVMIAETLTETTETTETTATTTECTTLTSSILSDKIDVESLNAFTHLGIGLMLLIILLLTCKAVYRLFNMFF